MKQTSIAVINLINAARAAPDAQIAFAECFTFVTTTGTQYTWTNVDYDVFSTASPSTPAGHSSRASNTKGASGLRSISSKSPSPPDQPSLIGRAPFLIALRDGAFDGAPVYRIVFSSMLRVALSLGVFGYSRDGSLLSITLVELRPL